MLCACISAGDQCLVELLNAQRAVADRIAILVYVLLYCDVIGLSVHVIIAVPEDVVAPSTRVSNTASDGNVHDQDSSIADY